MAKLPMIARYILGLILFVFGLNKFLNFMPPLEMAEPAMAFFGAMMGTGYMIPLIAVTEIVVGILLLSGRFVPMALVLLAPLSVNIVAFHLALAPAEIAAGALVFVLNVYLLLDNKESYQAMLKSTSEAAS